MYIELNPPQIMMVVASMIIIIFAVIVYVYTDESNTGLHVQG